MLKPTKKHLARRARETSDYPQRYGQEQRCLDCLQSLNPSSIS